MDRPNVSVSILCRNHGKVPDGAHRGAAAAAAVPATVARQHRARRPQRAASQPALLHTGNAPLSKHPSKM